METKILAQIVAEEAQLPAKTRTCHLATNVGTSFDVVIGTTHLDDICQEITDQVYAFPRHYQLMFQWLKPDMTVLDLGGHVGTFSLAAASLGCRVITVEASPQNAALLKASVKANNFARMQVVAAAVSDTPGTVAFVQAGAYGMVNNPSLQQETVSVPAVAVDRLLADLEIDQVDLIKMDIEGSERLAIQGMPKLLAGDDAPLILFESNRHTLACFAETPESLRAALAGFGYHFYQIEGQQLIPVQPPEPQFEMLVDILATKQRPDNLPGWSMGTPKTWTQQRDDFLTMAQYDHVHHRVQAGVSMATAASTFWADPQVAFTLDQLAKDDHPAVRAAVNWWPQAKASIPASFDPVILKLKSDLGQQLVTLQAHQTIPEPTFVSETPLAGPAIVAIRRAWNWMSTKWYVLPIVQRINHFHQRITDFLAAMLTHLEAMSALTYTIQQRFEAQDARLDRLAQQPSISSNKPIPAHHIAPADEALRHISTALAVDWPTMWEGDQIVGTMDEAAQSYLIQQGLTLSHETEADWAAHIAYLQTRPAQALDGLLAVWPQPGTISEQVQALNEARRVLQPNQWGLWIWPWSALVESSQATTSQEIALGLGFSQVRLETVQGAEMGVQVLFFRIAT